MNIIAKPIIKYAGGKRKLLGEIESRFPYSQDEEFNYIEPCVGGGAVLFWVLNKYPNVQKVVINDLNLDLINMYRVIQNDVESVIILLEKWQKEFHALSNDMERAKKYYLEKRVLYNSRSSSNPVHAALFIFLNKTGFNGMYRVNQKGEFNIGMGRHYSKPNICDSLNLKAASQALQKVTIIHGDFEGTVFYAKTKNTFFYIDPPYKPISKTAGFTAYTNVPFKNDEQVRLKLFCDRLNALGCLWVSSNSDLKNTDPNNNYFDALYADYHIDRVQTGRSINSKASRRGKVFELMIMNYEIQNLGLIAA